MESSHIYSCTCNVCVQWPYQARLQIHCNSKILLNCPLKRCHLIRPFFHCRRSRLLIRGSHCTHTLQVHEYMWLDSIHHYCVTKYLIIRISVLVNRTNDSITCNVCVQWLPLMRRRLLLQWKNGRIRWHLLRGQFSSILLLQCIWSLAW
jgi:hypothetical protein